MSRPKILLVAHHCNPEWGSEPLIGWRWAQGLAEHAEVHLVTHVRNVAALRRYGFSGRIHPVDTEALARRINGLNDRLFKGAATVNRLFLEALPQLAFDRAAVRIAKRLRREGRIDVIQRVSPISPRYPSGLGRLGLPFVLGPVNGGLRMAPGFESVTARENGRLLRLRGLAGLLSRGGRHLHDATRILVANETTRAVLPRALRPHAERMCENAIDPASFSPRCERAGRRLEVLFAGRLLPYKGADLLLDALTLLAEDSPVRVTILGKGPEEARLRALAAPFGARVRFLAAVPPRDVPAIMRAHDVLCLPSSRESGGAVLLEAMASGTVPICLAHGGPRETVPPDVGFALEAAGPEELRRRLARTLGELMADEPRRAALARRGVEWVHEHHTWEGRIGRALQIHEEITSRRARQEVAV